MITFNWGEMGIFSLIMFAAVIVINAILGKEKPVTNTVHSMIFWFLWFTIAAAIFGRG